MFTTLYLMCTVMKIIFDVYYDDFHVFMPATAPGSQCLLLLDN